MSKLYLKIDYVPYVRLKPALCLDSDALASATLFDQYVTSPPLRRARCPTPTRMPRPHLATARLHGPIGPEHGTTGPSRPLHSGALRPDSDGQDFSGLVHAPPNGPIGQGDVGP